ncbi:MAG TPA: hypothetical protein PLL30_12855 [Candidatus Krumholzibacteria bacterium]|nr:hypothetical protein [Candidatus Krumholzibacteria bacterium]HPD72659.1 hypothetical protein [Candidatus Krumholzibacteria bacterium]HRY40409.1 hypothetical protein [Candidatus Krumholzibacteria bacterium]
MKNLYACPHCRTNLNPNVKIILVASYRQRRGLILLSPRPGNFKFICDRPLAETITPGARVTFSCPVCAEDLTAPGNQEFVELHLAAPGVNLRRLYFSRTYGTHATFVDTGEEILAYGEDSREFDRVNFFGV